MSVKESHGREVTTKNGGDGQAAPVVVDSKTMFKLSYGLFVLTSQFEGKDNGCIVNTVIQITSTPMRISVAVNKTNYTHDMILKSGVFNVSILSESAPFSIFQQFGFNTGRDTDKFAGCAYNDRSANNIRYIPEHTTGVISAKVKESVDCGTHTIFVADVTQAFVTSGEASVTYAYYFSHIKPRPQPVEKSKKGFTCKICGYIYEGDKLPDDFICPVCKHGAVDFEPL